MRIAVAADHRGFEAKRKLLPLLKQMGHDADDFGCDGTSAATDYPDYAIPAAKAVTTSAVMMVRNALLNAGWIADRGVLPRRTSSFSRS